MDSSDTELRLRQAGLFVARVSQQQQRLEIEATPELDLDLMRLAAKVEMKIPFLFPSSPSAASFVNSTSSAASFVNSSSSAASLGNSSLVNSSSVANESVPRRVLKRSPTSVVLSSAAGDSASRRIVKMLRSTTGKRRSEKGRSKPTLEPPLPDDTRLRRRLRSASRGSLSTEYGAVANVRKVSTGANGEMDPADSGPGSKVDPCLDALCWLVERPSLSSYVRCTRTSNILRQSRPRLIVFTERDE